MNKTPLSDLIDQILDGIPALLDQEHPRIRLDLNIFFNPTLRPWHDPAWYDCCVPYKKANYCTVCFAGVWLILTQEPREEVGLHNFPEEIQETCNAIDLVRIGLLDKAVKLYHGEDPEIPFPEDFKILTQDRVTIYGLKAAIAEMRQRTTILRAAGY